MLKSGHYGVALLAYAPVGAGVARRGAPLLAVFGAAVVLSVAMLPDVDHRLPLVPHRGPTHSLAFALAVGAAFGAVGHAVAPAADAVFGDGLAIAGAPFGGVPGTAQFGFLLGALAVLAHLAADALTPAGIRPFWPVSNRKFSLYVVGAGNSLANYGLLALGAAATFLAALAALAGL